jgi:hypothetical protein
MKCAYCDKEATTTDALGLDVCADHAHEADEYYQKRTGRRPDEDSYLYCDEHCDMWKPGCERCEACAQHYYGMSVREFLDSSLNQIQVFEFDDEEEFIDFLRTAREI